MAPNPPLQESSLLFSTPIFRALKNNFKGDIVTPAHPDYEAAIQRWAKNAVRRAKVVAFVKDANDASRVVRYARESALPLAIRGGGHSPAGSSSSEGIVIDLSRYVNECRVDPERKLAYVGGGAIWKTVDETAIKHSLATVWWYSKPYRSLTLGGGYGWLAAAHGLAVDNLVQATMVLADGSIVTTSESENSDLFWGIRGGGCNFGICMEFVLQLHEQRASVYSGFLTYPASLVDRVFQITQQNGGKRIRILAVWVILQARGILVPFHNGPVEEGRKLFKEFLDLCPSDATGEVPYEQMNSLQNSNFPHGRNYYFQGAIQNHYSAAAAKKAFERHSIPKDAMAFNLRGAESNIFSLAAWDDDSYEAALRGKEAAHAVTQSISISEERPKASSVMAYGNYLGDEKLSSERSLKVFGENYPCLQQLKKKYDPDMLFSKWFKIVPA
ncbi:hypothetical protein ACEPAF_6498 [Sanghuangporus sanghuang]